MRSTAIVAIALAGLMLTGCSNESNPDPDGTSDTPACSPAFEEVAFLQTDSPSSELFVDGTVAYLSDAFGMRVVDVADPESPTELAYFEQSTPVLYFNDLTVRDGIAYVAGGIQGLITVDVASPSAPRYLDTAFQGMPDGRHNAITIALIGDIAVTAEDMRGLHVYDVSDPGAPVELAATDFHMPAHTDLAAHGDLVVVNDDGVIHLIDVSDPASPTLIESFADDEPEPMQMFQPGSHGFWLRDGLLFFGNGANLYVVDVSDPSAPAKVSTTLLDDGIEELFLDGDCLYAGHTNGAFTAVDVKDVAAPIPSEHVDTFGVLDTKGIFAQDGWVYLASRDQGLRVYRGIDPM